jgi:phosphoribosylaminoimidazolecarboxamide formyltransferase/IMP cyclohydrolase
VSLDQAVQKAKENGFTSLGEAVCVSDGFFPFADSMDRCQEAGIKYVVQPGGSIRDKYVINACNKFGMAMGFTGRRNFSH